jgi:hypothetical protein
LVGTREKIQRYRGTEREERERERGRVPRDVVERKKEHRGQVREGARTRGGRGTILICFPVGEAYERKKQYGKALKQFSFVEEHLRQIRDDEFDFHSYCLRKLTIRRYE